MLANPNAKMATDLAKSDTSKKSPIPKPVPACSLCLQAYPWEKTCQLWELVTCPNETPHSKTAPTH
jgi:hypothetical protein